jgi:hypothetical protein
LNGADNPDLEGAAVLVMQFLSIDNRFASGNLPRSGSFSVDSIGFPENPGQSSGHLFQLT